MSRLILPPAADAKDTIADYLAACQLNPSSDWQREQIIANCIRPVTLLIEAVELASAAGSIEEEVLIHFINALHAQCVAQSAAPQPGKRLSAFVQLIGFTACLTNATHQPRKNESL